MRLFPVLLVGLMMAGCSTRLTAPERIAQLTEFLHAQDGFVAAAIDPLPDTVRVQRTNAISADALLYKICRLSREHHWQIFWVRIYPNDRADWTAPTAAAPEFEHDCLPSW